MLRLPSSLERRLSQLFPKIREREQFVIEAIEQSLTQVTPADEDRPQNIGGTLHLFSDGGSRGNPGQAAIAYVLEDPVRGIVLKENGEVIGVETNNVAEYRAVIAGMEVAQLFHPNRLICHLDSELVVKQLNGEYKVKMPTLQQYVDEIRALAQDFPDIVFKHIPREDNFRADALVNKALDADRPHPRRFPPHPGSPQGTLFARR